MCECQDYAQQLTIKVKSLIDDAKAGISFGASGNSTSTNACAVSPLPSLFPAASTPPLSPRSVVCSPRTMKQRTSPELLLNPVLIEEVMDKLVKEDTLTKSGTNTYIINKLKKSDYEYEAVKEENDGLIFRNGNKVQPNMDEDHMYMKALYHALPMNYITVSKLHNKLEGEVN
ncbi:hypothetical protein POM88_035435 [Heracleum sosnowskyi]|uniref:Uncharacterized protein n=1 Tax=Heracleum sosnowskyi TaxID=360622 RepID=A0AAD8HN55_9APIA|nr:hypothetical protein POM88_035435 [Heracleum sosnowskyi]